MDSKIPNLALMKLSAYHKARGDHVEFYSPLFHDGYDRIYASKIFNFSDAGYLREEDMIIGGTGHSFNSKLPENVEHLYPDYELYDCKHAIGFLTRGCIRNCPWCVVPRKEGMIRFNAPLEEFYKGQEKILLLDNNFLAYHDHLELLSQLVSIQKRIDFNQGLDIRLITKKNAALLREMKRWRGLRYRFALDDPALIPVVKEKLALLYDAGFTNGILQFYVLVGFNTTKEQDLKRIYFLKERGIDVFVMPFNKNNGYQRNLARWVNRHYYKYETFKLYQAKKLKQVV